MVPILRRVQGGKCVSELAIDRFISFFIEDGSLFLFLAGRSVLAGVSRSEEEDDCIVKH